MIALSFSRPMADCRVRPAGRDDHATCDARLLRVVLATTLIAADRRARRRRSSKYPNWKGQWIRVGRRPGRVLGPDKPWGPGQQRAVHAGISGHFRGQSGGPGGRRTGHRPDLSLHTRRHAADHARGAADGDRHHARDHLHPARAVHHAAPDLHRRPRLAGASSSPRSRAIPSADGRTPTATAATTRSNRNPRLEGPRSYDSSGLPFHKDGNTVVHRTDLVRPRQAGHPPERDHDA